MPKAEWLLWVEADRSEELNLLEQRHFQLKKDGNIITVQVQFGFLCGSQANTTAKRNGMVYFHMLLYKMGCFLPQSM